jgi:hypothetical protein
VVAGGGRFHSLRVSGRHVVWLLPVFLLHMGIGRCDTPRTKGFPSFGGTSKLARILDGFRLLPGGGTTSHLVALNSVGVRNDGDEVDR